MQCKAKTKSGIQCSNGGGESGYCFVHSPNRAKERAEARKRGGRSRAAQHGGDASALPDEIATVKDTMRILAYTLKELLPMANGIARARCLISVALAFAKLIEVGEFEERLAQVEAILKASGGAR